MVIPVYIMVGKYTFGHGCDFAGTEQIHSTRVTSRFHSQIWYYFLGVFYDYMLISYYDSIIMDCRFVISPSLS